MKTSLQPSEITPLVYYSPSNELNEFYDLQKNVTEKKELCEKIDYIISDDICIESSSEMILGIAGLLSVMTTLTGIIFYPFCLLGCAVAILGISKKNTSNVTKWIFIFTVITGSIFTLIICYQLLWELTSSLSNYAYFPLSFTHVKFIVTFFIK